MSQEDSIEAIPNESNLLQSTVDVNMQSSESKSSTHDDKPIGGKKFQFSEFPEEGEQIKKPLKKPPARFRKKAEQNQTSKVQQPETPKSNSVSQPQKKIQVKSPDDIPIGGKKFEFSEFPQEGQQPKKTVKKPPAKFLERMKKQQNKQQQSTAGNQSTSAKNIDEVPIGGKKANNFDEQPIGGKKNNFDEQPIGGSKNNFDEQPIGGGSKNSFDEKPIGGGKKIEMSEYPQQGAPKPAPKKAAKKATKAPVKSEVQPLDERPTNQVVLDDLPVGGGMKKQGFDEQPIGKNNNFMMSEFPEGNEQPVVETNYTMAQKLKSKAVQMKLSGMSDLLKLLETNPNSQQLAEIEVGKLLKQTNPACLQKILQCFKIWVQNGKKWGDDEVKNIIENGYINGKPNTIKLAIQIVDQMYEKSPDVVQMSLLVGLKGKIPKTLAGYIAFLNELLKIYGMKRMKFFKPYIPEIIVILNRQKLVAVKTEGINILKQTYKWLSKQVVEPMIRDLKQNLKKQLQTFWQSHDKTQVMTAPKDIPDAADGKGKKKVDAYQLSEAVDVFKKYNQKFSETVINEEKWNQKVRMMQQFIAAANVPKLAHTQFRHITQMIRRLINHSNFNVVLNTLKILAVLSKGLRRPFAPTVKSQFSNVIGKFRDKKTQMIDETFTTLNEFNYCISIEDVIDDVKEGLADKTPNMKINLINWIGKFVEKKVQQKDEVPQKAKQALRSLFPIFQKLLADGVAEVRDTMIKNIGKMKILMGDQFFAPMDKKMSKGQTGKLDAVTKQLPKKVSKQKDPKPAQQGQSKPPKDSGLKTMENNSKVSNQGTKDISQQLLDYMAKMNHSDWQKRKESAEAIIGLISNNMEAKISPPVLFDFLNTLKARIADPNKNIVKYFVQLTGLIFETMSDKDIKINARNFICALADGLSDKVQANRKEIAATINKLGGIYGRQQLLAILGSYLDSDKQSRIEILNIILQNAEYLEKADTKQYPKGIIKGLTDKNKEIRNLAQRLLERIHQKIGLDIFKNLAKNQRPAIAKDLNTLLSKYQGPKLSNTAMLSKGVSPPKNNTNPNNSKLTVPPQPPSNKKTLPRSQSKGSKIHQQSFEKQQLDEPTIKNSSSHQFYSTIQPNQGSNNFLKQTRSMVQGSQDFAPLKYLSTERVHRQQKDERYPWLCDNLAQTQQQQLSESLQTLFRAELAKKMMAIDYRKVTEAASQIIKLSKDIAHHNQIREVYDLIFKWVFVRLWGGNPPINTILQVLPHVMSILEKKKLAINDGQVDIIVAILRESFITGYMNDYKVSQSLYLITKLLKALSSGDRLLKKLLRQFSVELTSIHRHVRKEATQFYRVGLGKLIKNQLMDYVGNGSSLEEASRIKQLKSDPQFVELLYKRFHQNVLDSFGFRNNAQQQQIQQPLLQKQQVSNQGQKKVQQSYQSTQGQQKSQIVQGKRTPTQSIEGRQTISSKIQENSRLSHRNQEPPVVRQPQIKQEFEDELDLRLYAVPPPGNPLGRHLAKLMTPSDLADTTAAFFTNFFADGGEKISAELVTYANIIFGAILKSVKFVIENRNDHMPQKIVNQINLLQQAIRCKFIINYIDQQLLYHGTRFALYQLVYEDEHKNMIAQDLISKGIDFKPDQFVKVINGIMLRILENACPQQIVNILLNLLNKQLQMPQVSQKTISLIIKCLSRVASNYGTDISPQRTKQFILRTVQYFNIIGFQRSLEEFNPNPDQKLKPEDNIIKTLKQIINDLIKNYGQQLWIHYQSAMSQSRYTDHHISQYIQAMGIAYPENIDSLAQEDQNLKKINELLSKAKTFDLGVAQLRKHMTVNPEFNPYEYFTNRGYEQKFIMMVMNALESSKPRKTPTKRQVREQRSQNSRNTSENPTSKSTIQDRIQNLRMRFEEVPQKKQQQRPQITQPSTTTAAGRKDQERGQQRALQIKRRIDQMKNRYKNSQNN